ncbi:Organic anion transporter polypeptide OATP [Trinorchestia longiramus]|nr:Organic anion transporter polypeptide OATP [Trinorchestia longiramus]
MRTVNEESTFILSPAPSYPGRFDSRRRRLGWLHFRPDCLQWANNAPTLLAVLSTAAIILGMVHMGFVNVSLTTIEKRYHMKSEHTGMIAGAFNVAFCVMCLPIAYLASQPGASRARWIGGGMVMVAVGSLVYAAPHFFTPPYNVTGSSNSNVNLTLCVDKFQMSLGDPVKPPDWNFNVFYVFLFAQVVMGTGCVPLVVLAVAFIDSSVSRRRSALFIGIFGAMIVTGAAFGFALGSFLLTYYVDWPAVDPATVGLSPANDLWLGCWWMGFVITGVASALVAVPLIAFPASIPKSLEDLEEDALKLQDASDDGPPQFKNLLTNIPFMGLACAEVFPSLLGAGMGAFMPKVVESQFSLSASTAALLVGVTGVPSGFLGSVLGGWLLKRFNADTRQTLYVCLWGSVALVFSSFSFFIYCPNAPFAGVTVPYHNSSLVEGLSNLESTCNSACGCQHVSYNPVCGSDNLIYYSPCHAGCSSLQQNPYMDKKVFGECSCVSRKSSSHTPSLHQKFLPENYQYSLATLEGQIYDAPKAMINGTILTQQQATRVAGSILAESSVIQDKCPAPCFGLLILFFACFFVVIAATFALNIASQSVCLRCVKENERDLAFALRSQVTRSVGGIMGPVLFGLFLDRNCLLWEQLDDGALGSCAIYEHFSMDRTLLYAAFIMRASAVFFYALAFWGHVRR